MSFNIRKFQAFVVTADTGSFTKAASVLGCSQSSTSRMVQSLEDRWGIRLLERGSAVSLTKEGGAVLPDIRSLCDGYARLSAHVDSLKGIESGLVSIAAPASIAAYRLPAILKRFVSEYVGVEVHITECTYVEAERLVRQGEVDFGFIPGRLDPIAFISTPFERDEILVVAPRGHFPPDRDRISLDEIAHERFVADTETAPLFQEKMANTMISCTTPDITVILALIEAGLGISLLPSLAVCGSDFDIETRHLESPTYRSMQVVHLRDRRLSLAASAFLRCLAIDRSN